MENNLRNAYNLKKGEIREKLLSFRNLSKEMYYKEFLFCLLTPQSNAKKCWEAVEKITLIKKPDIQSVSEILKSRTRFHNNKAKYIIQSSESFKRILPLLENPDKKNLRNLIAEKVKGYGLKEASHFLRNIGKSDNKIAILDRHILRNLKSLNIIKDDKIKNESNYMEVERKFIEFSEIINIPVDELDLLFWSSETGDIFK